MSSDFDDNIYSSVEPDMIDKNNQSRKAVLKFLLDNKGSLLTAREIAEACELPTGNTQVQVRFCITQLIEIDHEPIVATSKGFMYANSANQLRFYANQLQERKLGLQRRIDAVLRIAYKMEHNKWPVDEKFQKPVIMKLRKEIDRVREGLIQNPDKEIDCLVREAEGALMENNELEIHKMLIHLEKVK